MGAFTARNPALVHKLVLFAPQWLRDTPSLTDTGGTLGAYRVVSWDQARERWLRGVPAEQQAALIPAGWFEAWAEATFATDPWGNAQTPRLLRAPNGTVQDSRAFWAAGKPFYDPAAITAPVLIVHGDWDVDLPLEMARQYFARLTNASYRRWVEIGEGTHTLLLEKHRMQLFQAVQAFLDEDYAPEG